MTAQDARPGVEPDLSLRAQDALQPTMGKGPAMLQPEPMRAEPAIRPSIVASLRLLTGARTNPQKLGRCQRCYEPSGSGSDMKAGESRQARKRAEEEAGRRARKEARGGAADKQTDKHRQGRAPRGESKTRGGRRSERRRKRGRQDKAETSERRNPTRRPLTDRLPHPGQGGGVLIGWQRVRPASCAATPPATDALTWHASGVSPHLGTVQ